MAPPQANLHPYMQLASRLGVEVVAGSIVVGPNLECCHETAFPCRCGESRAAMALTTLSTAKRKLDPVPPN